MEEQRATHEGIQAMLQANLDQVPKMGEEASIIHKSMVESRMKCKRKEDPYKVALKMKKTLQNENYEPRVALEQDQQLEAYEELHEGISLMKDEFFKMHVK